MLDAPHVRPPANGPSPDPLPRQHPAGRTAGDDFRAVVNPDAGFSAAPAGVSVPLDEHQLERLEETGERIREQVLAQVDTPRHHEALRGEPSLASVPIVMCLWNRLDRIEAIVRQLDAQQGTPPLRLVLWCNRPQDAAEYRTRLAAADLRGALASIELFVSPENIRGIGRFLAVVDLERDGYEGPIVTLDDDQDAPADFIGRLLRDYRPQTVSGFWAWSAADDDYASRTRALPGDRANYVGTGGTVFDSAIVADRTFFTDLPVKGALIEDVWMTRWAISRGWATRRADAELDMLDDGRNQSYELIPLKLRFWRELQETHPLEPVPA